VRVDRIEFLAWTSAIAASTFACAPQPATTPETVVQIPLQVAPVAGPISAFPKGDAGAAVLPLATSAPAAPARTCDDTTPVPAVPACDMKNPCGEGMDARVGCRLWAKALAPRSAAKVVACLKRTSDPLQVCDSDFRTACAHEGFVTACPDPARFTAKCQKVVSGCEKGLHQPYDQTPISVERCIELLSATSSSGEKPMISCIEEYCGTVDESCLEFRMQHGRVLR